MAKRKGSSASGPRTRSKAAKEGREAREAENARRLDKLPLEVWDKILDHLESDDLFPLALSCRYFRQKQKELVERARQNGNPGLAWTTTLPGWGKPHLQGQPASADYLRFCSKEKVPSEVVPQKAQYIRRLAAFHGHLPLLQELLGHRWTIDYHNQQIAWAAAEGGQLETLQWLKTQKGYRLDECVFSNACKNGDLETSKWLRSEGCPWDEAACYYAAYGGHLEILKWLRSEGCPWDEATTSNAAWRGHLDVLKWAIDNGCPYEVNHMTRPALEKLGLI